MRNGLGQSPRVEFQAEFWIGFFRVIVAELESNSAMICALTQDGELESASDQLELAHNDAKVCVEAFILYIL